MVFYICYTFYFVWKVIIMKETKDERWHQSKYRHRREETPNWAKRIIVRRCSVCKINKPVWSNKNGIFCKECHEKRREEE